MKKIFLFFLILLTTLSTSTAKNTRSHLDLQSMGLKERNFIKIDPLLLSLFFKDTKNELKSKKAIESFEEDDGIVCRGLIKTTKISDLKAIAGLSIGSIFGNIVTAKFKLSSLITIVNLNSTVYVEASRVLYPNTDISVPETKANEVWQLSENSPIKGSGVLIGVIDTGIDWSHRDFISNDAVSPQSSWDSRIMYIWDQSLSSDPNYSAAPPTNFDYGLEYSNEMINLAIRGGSALSTLDTDGHGTHVAGIAAGDGSATDNYSGVAPNSKLIVCKNQGSSLWNYGLTSVGALDGLDWMMTKANALNMPLVVNQSQGIYTGPHNGNTLYEQAINSKIDEGLILVISAGNARSDQKHAQITITGGGEHEFIIKTDQNGEVEDRHIQLWYDTLDRFELVMKPDMITVAWSDTLFFNAQTTCFQFGVDGVSGILYASNMASPLGGNLIDINITYTGSGLFSSGTWLFRLIDADGVGNSTVHGYIERNIDVKFDSEFDENGTIAMPGSAANVITVASYNTKFSWLSNNGSESYPDANPLSTISSFSSKGPLRTSLFSKPDISAPGTFIGASYSSSTIWDSPDVDINTLLLSESAGNYHILYKGTSQAAPHVTGACAVLLQSFPQLTCFDLKEILKITARSPNAPGDVNDWGAGKLDILAAYKSMVGFTYSDTYPYKATLKNAYNHLYLTGLPVAPVKENWANNSNLSTQRMTNGALFYNTNDYSAYWLGEGIWTKWIELDSVNSVLGFPISTEYRDANNNDSPTVNFQHGKIYWDGSQAVPVFLAANFNADITYGSAPQTVHFSDLSTSLSTSITSWNWDFDNNGTFDSYEQNPIHVYQNPGVYSVTLIVSDGVHSAIETKNGYITVTQEEFPNIVSVEYFFDADPGHGNGISIPFSSAPTSDIQINITTASLALGLHRLYLRAKDENGNWGIAQALSFLQQVTKNQPMITNIEYFLDQDPGPGLASTIPITQAESIQIEENLQLASVQTGLHRLYVRGKDSNGNWGIPQAHSFLAQSRTANEPLAKITEIEYFYDADPGWGNGLKIPISSATLIMLDRVLPPSPFQTGNHTIYIRAKDEAARWGISQAQGFSIADIPMATLNEKNVSTTVSPDWSAARNLVLKNRGTLPLSFSASIDTTQSKLANMQEQTNYVSWDLQGFGKAEIPSNKDNKSAKFDCERPIQNKANSSGFSVIASDNPPNYLSMALADWLSIYPTMGTIEANDSLLIYLSMTSSDLDSGQYTASLHLLTNDPNNENIDVPVLLKVQSERKSITYEFPQGGWYLISLPVVPENNSLSVLFPNAIAAFSWDGARYFTETSLDAKTAYWLAVPQPGSQTITGQRVWAFTKHFTPGWNLLGTSYSKLPINNPDDNPDGSILTPLFSYNSINRTYESSLMLQPGLGYWVAALNETDLVINDTTTSLAKSSIEINSESFIATFGSAPPMPPEINWRTGELVEIPKSFALFQNYPNPFNPTTTIEYDLPKECNVCINIYDVSGQLVASIVDKKSPAGHHSIVWQGISGTGLPVASGLYFLKIIAAEFSDVKKMMLVK